MTIEKLEEQSVRAKKPQMKSRVRKQTFENAIVELIKPLGFVKTSPHHYEKTLGDGLAWIVEVDHLGRNFWYVVKGGDIDIILPTAQNGRGIASFRGWLVKNKLVRRAA
jgi:hypothetical protein